MGKSNSKSQMTTDEVIKGSGKYTRLDDTHIVETTENKGEEGVINMLSTTTPSSLEADSNNCVQSVHRSIPATTRNMPQKRDLGAMEDKLEYEALAQLKGHDFTSAFRAIKDNPTKQSSSEREYVLHLLDSLKREDVAFSPVEMNTLRNVLDVKSEGGNAFMKALDNDTIAICTLDYASMKRAKHMLSVKCGRVSMMKCNEDGGYPEPFPLHSYKSSSLTTIAYVTKCGITVSVYKADITQLKVDAIVNAANKRLAHIGGVALAIARVAGHDLQFEADEYIKTHGRLKVTDVVPTSSGNLPCKKVLHAVGPRWTDYQDKNLCQQHLAQTVFNCFLLAHKLHVTSLALCSISSGIFAVPSNLCARMYLAAVQRFDGIHGGQTSLRDIHFVDISDDMVKIMQDTFSRNLHTAVNPPSIIHPVSDFKITPQTTNQPLRLDAQHQELKNHDPRLSTQTYAHISSSLILP